MVLHGLDAGVLETLAAKLGQLIYGDHAVDAPAEHASERALVTWFGQAPPAIQAAAVGAVPAAAAGQPAAAEQVAAAAPPAGLPAAAALAQPAPPVQPLAGPLSAEMVQKAMGAIEQEKLRQMASRLIHSEIANEQELKTVVRAGSGEGDGEGRVLEAVAANHAQVTQAMKAFMTKALASGDPDTYNGQISQLMSEYTDNEAEVARQLVDLAARAKTMDGAERVASQVDFLRIQQQDTQKLITSIQDQTEALSVDDGHSLTALTGALKPPQFSPVWLLVPATIAAGAGAFAVYQRRKREGSFQQADGSDSE